MSGTRALATAAELVPELERSEAGSDLVIVRTQEARAPLMPGRGVPCGAVPRLARAAGAGERDPVDRGLRAPVRGPGASRPRPVGGSPRRPQRLGVVAAPGKRAQLRRLSARGGADGACSRRRGARGAARKRHRGRSCPCRETPSRPSRVCCSSVRGEYGGGGGSLRRRRRPLARVRRPYEEGHALFGRGRCLAALGRVPESAALLDAAREIFARLGAAPALAATEEWPAP